MKIGRKQFTLLGMRKLLRKLNYKLVSTKGDHEKWKKANCSDVILVNGDKELNRMLGRRLLKQLMEDNEYEFKAILQPQNWC